MKYELEFKPRAIKDLQAIPEGIRRQVMKHVGQMRVDMAGDVKRLTNFTPEYRLRVGDFRVLFEKEQDRLVIYRVIHRREAYR